MSKRIRQQKNDTLALNGVFGGGGLVAELCATIATPCTVARPSVHGISQERILECGAIVFSRGSSQPKNRTWDSSIAGGLLHCRWILYRLSYEGSFEWWFLTKGDFAPQRRTICGDIFHCPKWGLFLSTLFIEARNTATHRRVHRSAPDNKNLSSPKCQ